MYEGNNFSQLKRWDARAGKIILDENISQPTKEFLYGGLARLREDPEGTYLIVVSSHP